MSFRKFSAFLAGRRYSALPAFDPYQDFGTVEPATPVEEHTVNIYVKHSPHKRFFEVDSQLAAILMAGFPDTFGQIVAAAQQQPRKAGWSVETQHGRATLVLHLPTGERQCFFGEPAHATETFSQGYAHALPIFPEVLERYKVAYAAAGTAQRQ